ncbi:MAG: PDZ domain-containing protein [Thermoguttaceae bacterium]|nr:PDZ domain-containing protein [Thermoguttaceae bacterium]MDW8039098.1 trypsin-like peptidase domain-containing protein [Thermoguttaceae bacterium]
MTTKAGWSTRGFLVAGLCVGIGMSFSPAWYRAGRLRAAENPQAVLAALEAGLTEAIARAEKSVVAIALVARPAAGHAFQGEQPPDAFGRRHPVPVQPGPLDPDFVPSQYATGVVIDPNGLILTAFHALPEECEYFVTTPDRKTYRALIKGADPRSDLAVLSIEAKGLTPIAFGDAQQVRKGQIVIALGNPYAIARDGQASASWGIVSNLSRKAPPQPDENDPVGKTALYHFGTLIQTDARLNLGTSGGPLVNLQGEMIGLCVSLAAVAGYETAAGYAIPVDPTFRRVVDTLKTGREVEYGYLGVRRSSGAAALETGTAVGGRVEDVVPGSPAHRSGLRPGDLITAVNGKPIYDFDGLVLEVGKLPVESRVRLDVLRDGRSMTLEVVLSKYPIRGRKVITQRPPAWRGLWVDYLSGVVDGSGRPMFPALPFDLGVAVTEVQEGSPAWHAGLRPGMIISHVGRVPVRTPREFQEAVAQQTGFVEVRLADQPDRPVRIPPPGS